MDKDTQIRDLQERAHELQQLTEAYGWETFKDRLLYEYDQQQRRVTTGTLTPDEYQRACGVLQGLHQALTIPERVESELNSLTEREETMHEYAGFHDGEG